MWCVREQGSGRESRRDSEGGEGIDLSPRSVLFAPDLGLKRWMER